MIEWTDQYNPFNSLKALAHADYWWPIALGGKVPWPIMVSLDPCGACQLNCPHCNAAKSFDRGKRVEYSHKDVVDITGLLAKNGTKAVCVGGGGESTLATHFDLLLGWLHEYGITTGVVTNGLRMDLHQESMEQCCKWVGVSVDAATPETYARRHGCGPELFRVVCGNIAKLSAICPHVTFKYLLHPDNVSEVGMACHRAAQLGCAAIHIRPGAQTWFGTGGFDFAEGDADFVGRKIAEARHDLRDSKTKIFGITHKFTGFSPRRSFRKCWAGFTTCYIAPDGMVGLCCDRRGDESMFLCHYSELREHWGGQKHRDIVHSIDVSKCPRCTYCHVNEIFENVLVEDKMLCDMY